MTTAGAAQLSAARNRRLDRVRSQMVNDGVDVLLLSLGADMPWLSGYEAMPLERPTVLVVPRDAGATLVVPALEAPRVNEDPSLFALHPWSEGQDAVGIVADLTRGASVVGVSDRMWAGLLLAIQDRRRGATYYRASKVTGPIRAVKDEMEIASLKAAGAAADMVAAALLAGEIRLVGRSEAEVSAEISGRLIDAGHAKVNFAIVGAGPNAASPHHQAGERRIGHSETVVCDFGGTFHLGGDVGYCSDITRTVVTGPPSAELREVYAVLEAAQRSAVDGVAVGRTCAEVDAIGREIITAAGFGKYFIHRTGHGIGIEEHEDPYIVAGNETLIEPGHAFSVEPGIYLPGRMGARIEDIVVAGATSTLRCNVVDHGLTVVET